MKALAFPPSHRPAKRAFTLVEMLVVMAVVGILAGMLMPALSKSKDKAARMTDVNNLKQQTVALRLYADENDDTIPWPNWFQGDSPNRPGWLYTLDTSATGPARFKVETGVFWRTLQFQKVYMCPRDIPNPLFYQRAQQISSYVMNGAVIGYNRGLYPPLKLSSLRPSDVVFWEADEKEPRYFNDGASYPKEGVSARHNNGAINATFDGSVGFHQD